MRLNRTRLPYSSLSRGYKFRGAIRRSIIRGFMKTSIEETLADIYGEHDEVFKSIRAYFVITRKFELIHCFYG